MTCVHQVSVSLLESTKRDLNTTMVPPFLKRNQKKRGLNNATKATTVPRMCKSVSSGLSASESSSSKLKDCEVIGPVGLQELSSCPCCHRNLNEPRQTVGETRIQALYSSLFKDDGSETESCHSCDDMDEEGSIMFGVLSGGTPYSVTKNLVQGWVHKKGTGNDWMASRAWKPRWAVLSVRETSQRAFVINTLVKCAHNLVSSKAGTNSWSRSRSATLTNILVPHFCDSLNCDSSRLCCCLA